MLRFGNSASETLTLLRINNSNLKEALDNNFSSLLAFKMIIYDVENLRKIYINH